MNVFKYMERCISTKNHIKCYPPFYFILISTQEYTFSQETGNKLWLYFFQVP